MATDLAAVIADAFAEADEHAEKVAPAYGKRLKELLYTASERDEAIWVDAFGSMGLDEDQADIELDELLEIDAADRDALWYTTTSTVLAAAKVQAAIELVIRPMATVGIGAAPQVAKQSRNLDSANKRTFAKAGIGKAQWGAAKERRRGA